MWLARAALHNQLLHALAWNRLLPRTLGVPVPGALKAMVSVLILLATATCESNVYEVGRKPITAVMQRRPELAEALSRTLAEHQLGTEAVLSEREREERNAEVESLTRQLLGRVREFLDLRRPGA